MTIRFTQFLRPNGQQVAVGVDRADGIEQRAERLQRNGCRFEVEVLTTGDVSFEVLAPWKDEEGDPVTLAMLIVENGPGVMQAVDTLVVEATLAFCRARLARRTAAE